MFAAMLGGWEIVLILAVVLILFGAKKLPELAKGLGQGIKEFKKATREVTDDSPYTPPANRVDYTPPKKLPEESTPQTASPVAQSTEQKS